MRNFLRLLRYGLPYTLEWLPGVIAVGAVGLLDTFRVLLLAAHSSIVVLNPESARRLRSLLGLPNTPWHFDLQQTGSALHAHSQCLDVVAFALVGSHRLERALRLRWAPTW